jgi:ribosomal protein S18 acetylase RimI-like enzyme
MPVIDQFGRTVMAAIEGMDGVKIRSATRADEAAVLNVITVAFTSDPVARWVLPDAGRYLAQMPRAARAFGGNGFDHGTIFCAEDFMGAAMWLPPGVEPDTEALLELFERNVAQPRLDEAMSVMEAMGSHHPAEPHWYLPLIGVDPSCQGCGLGSVLMRHALERCDADGMPAYLESSNPRNISLYLRHGFKIVGSIQVGSSPEVVPMIRLPQA